jgi:SAM-dependent methyltransferase
VTLREAKAAVRAKLRYHVDRLLERRYGAETADHLYLEDLGEATEDRIWHHPSSWLPVRRALRRLKPRENDVFADIGSGLGRAVIAAAELPFARVIGVELSAELTERARANLGRSRTKKRARSIELVTTDALTWDVPDDLSVVYFYSPFVGEVFDGVVANILTSLDRRPRPMRLVYNFPVEHNRLLRTGRVRVLDVASSVWPQGSLSGADVILTYQLLPGDEAARAAVASAFPVRIAADSVWMGEHEPGFVLIKPERLGGVYIDRRG